MFFHKWRQKRKRKVFHAITTLQKGSLQYSFHPIIRKAKTTIKEIKPTIIHQETKHHHIHHMLTLHVHQSQACIQVQNVSQHKSMIQLMKKLTTAYSHPSQLSLQMPPIVMKEFLQTQLQEEKRYYQYHPAKAKALAISYFQHIQTQKLLANERQKYDMQMLLHKHPSYLPLHVHKASPPAVPQYNQQISFIYKQQQIKKQQIRPNKSYEQTKSQKPMYIDMNVIIQTVYREIQHRLQREQQRKGR